MPYQRTSASPKRKLTVTRGKGDLRVPVRRYTSRPAPARTGQRQGTANRQEVTSSNGISPPVNWLGTVPEGILYSAHLELGLIDGRDFQWQYYFGEFGDLSSRIDFYEFAGPIAVEVQGIFWHYGFLGFQNNDDIQRRINLEARGIIVVFIDEDMIVGPQSDPVGYLIKARQGIDLSRVTRGVAS